jgi:hypothetical protein
MAAEAVEVAEAVTEPAEVAAAAAAAAVEVAAAVGRGGFAACVRYKDSSYFSQAQIVMTGFTGFREWRHARSPLLLCLLVPGLCGGRPVEPRCTVVKERGYVADPLGRDRHSQSARIGGFAIADEGSSICLLLHRATPLLAPNGGSARPSYSRNGGSDLLLSD